MTNRTLPIPVNKNTVSSNSPSFRRSLSKSAPQPNTHTSFQFPNPVNIRSPISRLNTKSASPLHYKSNNDPIRQVVREQQIKQQVQTGDNEILPLKLGTHKRLSSNSKKINVSVSPR